MIRKWILISPVFWVFGCFAQTIQLFPKPNTDSLRADSLQRIGAFPEYFRLYVQELKKEEQSLDQVVCIKRRYPDVFVREFRKGRSPLMFGELIAVDTPAFSDNTREKMKQLIHDEGYLGFRNAKLNQVELVSYNQRGSVTWSALVSNDRKAILIYLSTDYLNAPGFDPNWYYYHEGVLVAVQDACSIVTSEHELSRFLMMRSLPEFVLMVFELGNQIVQTE